MRTLERNGCCCSTEDASWGYLNRIFQGFFAIKLLFCLSNNPRNMEATPSLAKKRTVAKNGVKNQNFEVRKVDSMKASGNIQMMERSECVLLEKSQPVDSDRSDEEILAERERLFRETDEISAKIIRFNVSHVNLVSNC